MSLVGIIGTIVFFAVVALALLAVADVLFSSGGRGSGKAEAAGRKPGWLGSALPACIAKVIARTTKHGARRQESRTTGHGK
jgi:hypothetical protein